MQDSELAAPSSGRVLRAKAGPAYMGVGKTKFWELAKSDPDFPRLFKIGSRITVLFVRDADAYLAKQRAKFEEVTA